MFKSICYAIIFICATVYGGTYLLEADAIQYKVSRINPVCQQTLRGEEGNVIQRHGAIEQSAIKCSILLKRPTGKVVGLTGELIAKNGFVKTQFDI